MHTSIKCAAFLFVSALAAELKLVTFDGAVSTTASWRDTNDPVMGGGSTSTFETTAAKTGVFNGTCAIVGFLKAPGFAKIMGSAKFADISDYDSIALRVKSSTSDYQGFKVAFAAPGIPKTSMFGGASYKAGFNLTGSDWQLVEIPLAQFSYDWSGYTGRCDTKDPDGFLSKGKQHYCCSNSGLQPSKPEVCVDAKFLSTINSLEVWAEGVKGDFNIEIDWIGATKTGIKSTLRSLVKGDVIDLATFDGKAPHKWSTENDPVMGGQSDSTIVVNKAGYADYSGNNRIVPSLKAPGFTFAHTEMNTLFSKFPDASGMDGIILGVRNMDANVTAFKFAFCDSRVNPYRCQFQTFKADFSVPVGTDFSEVFLPWAKFSDKWSSTTGEHTAEEPPTASSLKSITQVQIWTEGVAGHFHLQVKYVRAGKAPAQLDNMVVLV